MSNDGTHLICKEHEQEKYYCPVEMAWTCIECELGTD